MMIYDESETNVNDGWVRGATRRELETRVIQLRNVLLDIASGEVPAIDISGYAGSELGLDAPVKFGGGK